MENGTPQNINRIPTFYHPLVVVMCVCLCAYDERFWVFSFFQPMPFLMLVCQNSFGLKIYLYPGIEIYEFFVHFFYLFLWMKYGYAIFFFLRIKLTVFFTDVNHVKQHRKYHLKIACIIQIDKYPWILSSSSFFIKMSIFVLCFFRLCVYVCVDGQSMSCYVNKPNDINSIIIIHNFPGI